MLLFVHWQVMVLNLRLRAGMELAASCTYPSMRFCDGAIRTRRAGNLLRAFRPELGQILGHEIGRAV